MGFIQDCTPRFVEKTIVFIVTVLLSCSLTAGTASAAETSTWKWTAETPKPIWWDWGPNYSKEKPVRGGYLRTAAPRYIGLMNPNHWPVNDFETISEIYEMIIFYDGEFKPTVNWLAESWRYTGSTSAVMKLKKGIKFHDGSDFNAESIKYQFDWIKNPKNGAFSRAWLSPIKSVSIVDEHTVRFEFNQQWAAFAGVMANVPGYALSKKALEADGALKELVKIEKKIATAQKKIGKLKAKAEKASGAKAKKALKKAAKEKKKLAGLERKVTKYKKLAEGAILLDKHAVGTGKFMVEEARPGNYLKLKRNPNWWFGQSIGKPEMPYFDGMKVNVIPDPSVRLANLRAGKVDKISIIKAQYNLLKRDPNSKIHTYMGNHWRGFQFNHAEGPFKDIRLRKAVSHAIDRRALIMGTQFGLAVEASCAYPATHWGHNPDLKPVRYDPELSRKLLAEAGHADGLTIKGIVKNREESMTVATAAKNMLKKVGIDWQYDVLDPAAESDRLRNREYDLRQGGYSFVLDPDLMATAHYHRDGGFNYGRSTNQTAIRLIEAARTELDPVKRRNTYWKFEKALYDNYEDVWLYWPKETMVFSKNVMGWNQAHYLAGRAGHWFSHCRWFKDGHP
ncbi:MAG: ABC transporter substrate-binding protein [Proteobacteria bacterium]|nr:ABC transporter substrate-binding protein [Pseudomonadota bacterium]